MTLPSFKGQIALVTGASRGLGYETARLLGALGAQVIAVARTAGGLEELDDAIRAAGGTAPLLVPLDLTDSDGVDRLGAALFERYGKIDLLVHCAALSAPLSPLAHVTPKDFDKVFAINTQATYRLLRSADALLRASDSPQAVFLTDSKAGGKFWAPYGASKCAMGALARSYAAENPRLDAHFFEPPAMPTALRARTHPGENKDALPTPRDVAEELVSRLG